VNVKIWNPNVNLYNKNILLTPSHIYLTCMSVMSESNIIQLIPTFFCVFSYPFIFHDCMNVMICMVKNELRYE